MHDSGGKRRILIFATRENLLTLGSCDIWCCDGTFATVSRIYYHVYSIYGYKGNKVLPLVFILMPNKKEKSYTEALSVLKSVEPSLGPKHVLIDFSWMVVFFTSHSVCGGMCNRCIWADDMVKIWTVRCVLVL